MILNLSKRTKIIIGKLGHSLHVNPDGSINVNAVLSSGLNTPVDERPPSSVDIDSLNYSIIHTYILPNTTFNLTALTVSFIGMSGHFVLKYHNGAEVRVVREYWIQNPTSPFVENLGAEIPFDPQVGSYLEWTGKTNGVGQNGKVYAVISGYKS